MKKLLIIFSCVSILGALTSCGVIVKSKANKYLTEDMGAIPPDFGKNASTTLFITHHGSYNRYMKRNVEKIYQGAYEFATTEQYLSDERFQDIDKYRFVFDFNYIPTVAMGSVIETPLGPEQNTWIGKVKKFRILDRKENKEYVSKMTSGYWSKLQKVYLKKLNEKIQSEQVNP
ncbi:MAG: hypothetical protein AAFX55_15015 [Bacteroidota bacterium]